MLTTTQFFNAFARAGFLVDATVGAQTVKVNFRSADIEIFSGGQQSTEFTITYPAAAWTLTAGATIVIAGTSYKVQGAPKMISDGSEMLATLARI